MLGQGHEVKLNKAGRNETLIINLVLTVQLAVV